MAFGWEGGVMGSPALLPLEFGAVVAAESFDRALRDPAVNSFSDEAAFPGCVMVNHRQDGEHQRAGIDRSLTLPNAKQILIDEKWRSVRADGRIFGDVLLEYVSNDKRNTPGWVVKPLRADYIAYAIEALSVCYLLPVPQLQQAWRERATEWISTYRTISAGNDGYRTLSCPVPVRVLYPAIGSALRVSFSEVA
jgi:hypothetical protein